MSDAADYAAVAIRRAGQVHADNGGDQRLEILANAVLALARAVQDVDKRLAGRGI